MSVLMDRAHIGQWQVHPGWGITVDLTPPEVAQARRAKVYQRLIAAGLVLVVLACTGAVLLARAERAQAQRDYDREQANTASLLGASQDFAAITAMQSVTTEIRAQLATLLAQDVDFVNLMARIRQAAPAGLTIEGLSIVLTPTNAAAAPADPAAAAVDPADQVIGTVSISGTAVDIDAVTAFVAVLNDVPGTSGVLPSSITQGDTDASYSISLDATARLRTASFQTNAAAAEGGAQ